MNASQLKKKILKADPENHFFDYKTMRFFGDTMRNFGVKETVINTWTGDKVEVYELYRKNPVRTGLKASHYFDKKTFERRFEK